jgi:DNA-binding transcriptional ArsR family regulator
MLKNSPIAPPVADKLIAAGFHALSDPLRLQILELLREQELCVCDLCDRLNVTQSKLSFHLKALKDAALVRSRQEGEALAEFLGTFILVFAGTGAVMVNKISQGAITHLGVSFVFGAVVAAMIYATGHISRCPPESCCNISFLG